MFEGAYPPGVTGKMIDDTFEPVEPPESCFSCMFYEERTCGCVCSVIEAEYTAEELDAMTDEEYMKRFSKYPDDYCKDYKRWED